MSEFQCPKCRTGYASDKPWPCPSCGYPGTAESPNIPRRPWLLSRQYGLTFVLSQDNEIIIGDTACRLIDDAVLHHIISAVNAYEKGQP